MLHFSLTMAQAAAAARDLGMKQVCYFYASLHMCTWRRREDREHEMHVIEPAKPWPLAT